MSSSTRRSLNKSLPGSGSTSAMSALEARVLSEMDAAWQAGQPVPAEVWFRQHPQLAERAEVGVRIVYEEMCLREKAGETVAAEELFGRFAQWRDELDVLLNCHHLFDSPQLSPTFPEIPSQLGEFRLLKELDRGAAGRVYLATQPELSDRKLVVKLTFCEGEEHLSLARLQHSHIVPLFLVQDFADQNLRAMVMPYLGGMSWARMLEQLRATPLAKRSGQQIVTLLAACEDAEWLAQNAMGPATRFLSRATYEQSVCWLGSCLAEALHYAHQRGLVHLDIKPSNVLLAGDGQPMLLDFHLALELSEIDRPLERLGGTRGYMSPEQQAASSAISEGRPVNSRLDGRSDLFSLGTLLYESLCGRLPPADEAESRREIHSQNAKVTRGLEDIVHKCLAREPAARYQDAGALAADLRRQMADLPLAGVPNRSLPERWQKWRRRRPHAAALIALALITCGVVGGGAIFYRNEQVRHGQAALERAERQIEQRQYGPAIEQLEEGLQTLRLMPGTADLKGMLSAKLVQSQKAALAQALHVLVERLRVMDSFENVPVDKLRQLEAGCVAVWQSRTKILQSLEETANQAAADNTRADLLDLVLLWTELQTRIASENDVPAIGAAALARLEEIERLGGPSNTVALARQHYDAVSANDANATADKSVTPKTAWEHLLLGRWLFHESKLEAARHAFQQAIDLEPSAFWPYCYLALCDFRLDKHAEAVSAATVCVALSPQNAACYYNRALAEQALGQRDQALRDFDRAVQIDPTLGTPLVQRGLLLQEMNRHAAALADFHAALAAGEDPAMVHFQIARLRLAMHDRPAALASLRQSLEFNHNYVPARQLLSTLQGSPNEQ